MQQQQQQKKNKHSSGACKSCMDVCMNGDTIRKVCMTEGWTCDSCKMFKKQTQKKIGRKEMNEGEKQQQQQQLQPKR